MTGTREVKTAIVETEVWIDEFLEQLGWQDRDKAYIVLVAALHGLRDSMPWDEAATLGAYFPPLLRGLYFEGWHPTGRSFPLRSREAFLERIHDAVHQEPGVDPEFVGRALFALLARRLPAAELEDAKAVTPQALHAFWPV